MQVNKVFACLIFIVFSLFSFHSKADDTKREFYQLTVFHFINTQQEQIIDQYLEKAYLPALHKRGIKLVGVFKPIVNDTAIDKIIYILIPLSKLEQVKDLSVQVMNDKVYLVAGKEYLEASAKNPPYQRMENILLQAFALAPVMQLPKLTGTKNERIYELRSYESATEKLYRNKVQMFNEGGEIALFKRLEFNAVFYAEVIAGHHMPNLMYMTSFENKAERDIHWKKFGEDPEWKRLSSLPQYQNNVSKADIILMNTAPYSDY
ncbi:MAG: NIPSNAP family protein [Bacteroidota bacterium]|nr:NIPSNAP family protein [Bacteroidota bacterium]